MTAIARFDLPAAANPRLGRVLTAALNLPNSSGCTRSEMTRSPWDASFFNLPQVTLFQTASTQEQQQILAIANHSLLTEAYFVEAAGMGYMAKMSLLAESLEERMLYSLFAADEAQHFHQIRGFFAMEQGLPNPEAHPFLQMLAELVESAEREVLLFVIQVILEGWGMSHYRSLARGCGSPTVAAVFQGFLEAEARHHATGAVLWESLQPSRPGQQQIIAVLVQFLQMVQVGPQNLLGAIAQVRGDLSRAQRIQVLEQLDIVEHSGVRLRLLRSLMQGKTESYILEELDQKHCFTPYNPSQAITLGGDMIC